MNVTRRLRQRRRSAAEPELAALWLATPTIAENSAPGTAIGAILGRTPGSAVTLADDAGGRFAIGGGALVAGPTGTDHEAAASHAITLRETLTGYANSPRDTVLSISVGDVDEGGPGGGATYLVAQDGDRLVDDHSNPLILEAA